MKENIILNVVVMEIIQLIVCKYKYSYFPLNFCYFEEKTIKDNKISVL